MGRINIAIDGPSAAGKSTIAKMLGSRLNYIHLDSGAMYRCTAYKADQMGLDIEDEAAICKMLEDTSIVLTENGDVILDGTCVSKEIRTDAISQLASRVSKLEKVRADLVARQMEMAKDKGFIMDGRDIGTVVLKDAEVKVFLTATARARAMRRLKQNNDQQIATSDLETIEKEIEERDYRDTHRAASPLKKADDAVEIDSSNLCAEEVLDAIYALVLEKIQKEDF